MEQPRKEKSFRSGLLSANDLQLGKWYSLGKTVRENIEHNSKRLDGGKKDPAGSPKKLESVAQSKPEPEANVMVEAERSKRPKVRGKGAFFLELKNFKKAKTAREPDVRPEMQRFLKPSDRVGREEVPAPEFLEEASLGGRKFPSFHDAWEHTNFSVVPTEYIKATKDPPGRERKRKKSVRTRKRNKSARRAKQEEEKDVSKKEEADVEVLYPAFDPVVKERRKQESGGQAVVIYQRHNRRDMHPQTGDGYRFEQIAFSGNCEATVDVVQSRRSLSEPRQHSPKELYVAKRRTRFQIEPSRMASTQSDFHSALDILKQSSASVEFNKFEGVDRSFTRIIYQNPLNKAERGLVCRVDGKERRDSTTTTMTGLRLKQTAEKKLDLHREMMRAEKTSKKKFWESIERSLNYRCALAEMLSSQSFLAQKNSAKFFSTTESSTRSTNIYVRESVISSYQGFQRFVTSNQTDSRNKSENITQTSCETFRKMKSLLDSFLIKEAEDEGGEEETVEEEILLDPSVQNGYGFRSTSESTFITKRFVLSQSASDRLSLLENNLIRSETKSDLELLMSKLSEEIRKCSLFIGQLKGAEGNAASVKLTASDSRVELNRGLGGEANSGEPDVGEWFKEQAVFPVSLRHSRDRVQSLTGDWGGRNKNQIHFGVREQTPSARMPGSLTNLQRVADPNLGLLYREGSNTSLLSYMLSSVPSVETQFSKSKKAGEVLCCDDCKRLKKKIQRLEKELEKMERRMPFYPVEYQNSIKCCLESLKATSETVLKRLRSCAKLRYLENQKRRTEIGQCGRPQSAPTAAVHKVANKHLSLRSSNSDYQLQVGMELTMENVDPATGKKLHPEVSQGYEQEGNVQCRMFKSEGEPVLLMDTDFTYNPKTGMLFKTRDRSGGQRGSAELMSPLQEARRRPSALRARDSEQSRQSFSAFECLPKEKPIFSQDLSSEKTSATSEEATTLESIGESTSQITDVSEKAHESEETEVEDKRCAMSRRGSFVRKGNREPLKKHHELEEDKERGKKSCRRSMSKSGESVMKKCEIEEERERGRRTCRGSESKNRESVTKHHEPEEEKEKRKKSSRRIPSRSGESVGKLSEVDRDKENERKSCRRLASRSRESLRKLCEEEEEEQPRRKKSSRRGESRSKESLEKWSEVEEEEKENGRRSRRRSASRRRDPEEHERRCSWRRKSRSRESLEKLCEVEEEEKVKKKKSSRRGVSMSRESAEKSCEEEEKPKRRKSRRRSESRSEESLRKSCEVEEEEKPRKKKSSRRSRSRSKECSKPEEGREDERKGSRRRKSRSRESLEVWCEMEEEEKPKKKKGFRRSHSKSRESPRKHSDSEEDTEKEGRGRRSPSRSGESLKKHSKKEEDKEKEDKSYGSTSTSKDSLKKHNESEEDSEKEKKSPRKSLSKSKEALKKVPGSVCSISEVKKPEEPSFESKKLEEIALQLSELKELALESKKLEECGLGSRKVEKSSSELKEVELSAAELKQLEKSTSELKQLGKSTSELKQLEKSASELKQLEKSTSELKRVEKSSSELKKLEKSTSELKKPEKSSSELGKLEECAAETEKAVTTPLELKVTGHSLVLHATEKGGSELKVLEEGTVEPRKEQKGGLRSRTPGGRTQESKAGEKSSSASRKKDEKAVSRIPTRRKTTPSSPDPLSQRSSRLSLLTTAGSSLVESYSSSATSKILVKLAKLFSFTWTFGFFLCKWVHYMQNVSAICSVLTLTAMSLERYYAIVHPMKAQYICTISQARRIITATWISAFLLAVPILFAQVHLKVGVKVEAYWCVRDWDNRTIWRAHELYMMLLILVIPTGVMAVAYTAICWEIWEVIQRRHDMTSGKGHAACRKPRLQRSSSYDAFPSSIYTNSATRIDSKRRLRGLLKRDPTDDGASVKQVIKMLVAVVVIYVICWGPMLIDNVLQAYGVLSHIRMGWLKYMGTAFHLMAYFNSCINPIIYGFMSKNFRESFRKTLCCVRKKPKTAYRSFSLSQTRNTSIRYAESSFGRTVSIALPV